MFLLELVFPAFLVYFNKPLQCLVPTGLLLFDFCKGWHKVLHSLRRHHYGDIGVHLMRELFLSAFLKCLVTPEPSLEMPFLGKLLAILLYLCIRSHHSVIAQNLGWEWLFYIYGIIGVIWSLVWVWYFRNSPGKHLYQKRGKISNK